MDFQSHRIQIEEGFLARNFKLSAGFGCVGAKMLLLGNALLNPDASIPKVLLSGFVIGMAAAYGAYFLDEREILETPRLPALE
jgi:hypothetical protein